MQFSKGRGNAESRDREWHHRQESTMPHGNGKKDQHYLEVPIERQNALHSRSLFPWTLAKVHMDTGFLS